MTDFESIRARIPVDYKIRARALDRFVARHAETGLLKALELQVLTSIATHADSKHRRCWCGPQCLADETSGGRGLRSIERAIANLVKTGAIARKRAEGAARGEWWYVPVLVDEDLDTSIGPTRREGLSRSKRRRLRSTTSAHQNVQLDLLPEPRSSAKLADDRPGSPANMAGERPRSTAYLAGDRPATLYTGVNVYEESDVDARRPCAEVISLAERRPKNPHSRTPPAAPALFTPEEQGACRLVETRTEFRWVDAAGGEQHLGKWFAKSLIPLEDEELAITFARQTLATAIDLGKSGPLHGWLTSAVERRFAKWKSMRAGAVAQGKDPEVAEELRKLEALK